jgi:hypothetical protein
MKWARCGCSPTTCRSPSRPPRTGRGVESQPGRSSPRWCPWARAAAAVAARTPLPPPDNPYEVDFGELALASDPRACRAAGVEPLTQVTQPAPPPSLPTTMMIIIPLSSFVRPRSPVSDPLNRGATLCARAPLCAAPPMAMCGLSRRRLRAAGAGPELRRDGASAARDLPLWWGCPSHPLFRSRFVTGAHLRLQCVSRALVTKIKGGHGQTRALHRWWRATWRRRRSAI